MPPQIHRHVGRGSLRRANQLGCGMARPVLVAQSGQTTPSLTEFRQDVRDAILADEAAVLTHLRDVAGLDAAARATITAKAVDLVRQVREGGASGMLESFLA